MKYFPFTYFHSYKKPPYRIVLCTKSGGPSISSLTRKSFSKVFRFIPNNQFTNIVQSHWSKAETAHIYSLIIIIKKRKIDFPSSFSFQQVPLHERKKVDLLPVSRVLI
ncbi:hypothetical protein PYW07_009466 [Mythimna separata]|uniref:Uncharacterized protein n=1 Tax=Mythimna separata TaxID=271217 RepID=A0AAD7YCA7_MYTSE|nr:hypothetical protein PYW07_009466 [Mythimna separata]